MSPKNPPLIVGLAAPGLLWLATSVANAQGPPQAPPGPNAPASTPSSPKAYQTLLLSNGKVIKGEIVEIAPGQYRLRTGSGSVVYPKIMVQVAGESVEDLYRYQVARLPDGDPDERMKLAKWCLTEHLAAHATEQLEAIQAMCPGDAEVKRMLYNLASAVEKPQVDPGLRQTSGEMPATLDPRVVTNAKKRFHALPEIFDLPPAQAVRRANDFAEFVQPVLQQSCARCHSEKYQGDFQLVEVRNRRDQVNPDIARANLDATLRLINPDDPARSELLSSGLVPHPAGSRSAIFRGANDRNYQVLAQWAKSLKAGQTANGRPAATRGFGDAVNRTGYAPSETAQVEGFASERSTRSASSKSTGADSPDKVVPGPSMPQSRAIVEQYDESAEFVRAPGDRPEFPLPFAVGGAPSPRPAPPRAKAPTKPGAPANTPPTPPASKRTATPAGPGAVTVTTDNPNELPGMDQPRYPPKAEDADPDEKKPSKKIDGAQLEKLLRSRNGGGTP